MNAPVGSNTACPSAFRSKTTSKLEVRSVRMTSLVRTAYPDGKYNAVPDAAHSLIVSTLLTAVAAGNPDGSSHADATMSVIARLQQAVVTGRERMGCKKIQGGV
jgi:hypothetical protein